MRTNINFGQDLLSIVALTRALGLNYLQVHVIDLCDNSCSSTGAHV